MIETYFELTDYFKTKDLLVGDLISSACLRGEDTLFHKTTNGKPSRWRLEGEYVFKQLLNGSKPVFTLVLLPGSNLPSKF